jgi:DNA-binding CsgD family transcriptional regulator
MAINYQRSLLIIAILLAVVFSLPGIALAHSGSPESHLSAIVNSNTVISEENFTPQERQQLQAISQGRNKEIAKVLDKSQHQQLEHYLRSGHSFEDAVEALDLERDQWDMIQAIFELDKLKIKRILRRIGTRK